MADYNRTQRGKMGDSERDIMPEEIKAAQTIEPVVEKAIETPVVVSTVADPAKAEAKIEPKPDKNAEYARRRREEEARDALDKAGREAELKTAIRLTGGVNPFTQGKIEDQADLDELYLMKEIEAKGGDPVADFAKHLKEKRKTEQGKVEKKEMSEERARKDWQSFHDAHPEITLDLLNADAKFLKFAKGKIGNMPLAEIYDDYLDFAPKADPEASKKAAIEAKKAANPGSLKTETPKDDFFTKEQVVNMTEAERQKNIVKIRTSREHWNK